MKVYSGEQLPRFQVSGQELRVHWDAQEVPAPSMDDTPRTQWEQNEALCAVADTRSQLIEKIIGSVHDTGSEIALINNADAKPDQYAAYQAFRALAKSLADEWLAARNA
jgi:hypothetical protein